MRTTITLDEDVAALLERERQRTGESQKSVTNRLLRRGLQRGATRPAAVKLLTLPGRPTADLSDTSAVIAALDDEHAADKGSF